MFGNDSKPTIVYRYDVRTKMQPQLGGMDFVREQLGLARRFRNLLIEAELAGRKAYREARSEAYPDFAALEGAATEKQETVDGIVADIAKANARERKKRATPEERERLVKAKKELKEARVALKARRQDIAGASLSQAAEVARDTVVDAAHEWANGAGLFQGTKWAVVRAVFQSCRTAKEDPGFRKWDGTGRLSLQLQAQKVVVKRKGPATWANIALGKWVSHLSFRREGKWTIFRVRFGSDAKGKPIYVECPVDLHREWPPDAVCKWVELICTRTGRDYHYKLCFSLAREAGWNKPTASTGEVGIHLGWRLVEKGLRVACWSGSDGREGELVIPESRAALALYGLTRICKKGKPISRLGYYTKPSDLASMRDVRLDEVKPVLLAHAATLTLPDDVAETISHLHAIKSKSRVLAIVNALPGELPPFLVEWRRKEIHLERYESGQRAKFERWRKDFYRCFWAAMREQYSVAYMPKITWTREKPGPEKDSEGGMVEWRACASPGLLSMLGRPYATFVEAKDISRECHVCGGTCDVGEPLSHTCEHCGSMWDQDMNAARNANARGKVMV